MLALVRSVPASVHKMPTKLLHARNERPIVLRWNHLATAHGWDDDGRCSAQDFGGR